MRDNRTLVTDQVRIAIRFGATISEISYPLFTSVLLKYWEFKIDTIMNVV